MDYSDDDGMLNIESGEENLYIDHTSEADYGMEEDMHNDSTSKRDQISYIVLKEEDIREHQKTDIKQISTVLSINQVEAIILLLHYQWSSSKVEDEWFTSEERVRKTVGMLKEHMVDLNDQDVNIGCGICFESYLRKEIATVSCGHPYCKTCWTSYITEKINNGPGCLMIKCPEPSCYAVVGQDMIDKLITIEEDKEKYCRYFLRSYVKEGKNNIKWCPSPGCVYAVDFGTRNGTENYVVTCLCSYDFCWNCSEDAHRPVNCDMVLVRTATVISRRTRDVTGDDETKVKRKRAKRVKRTIDRYMHYYVRWANNQSSRLNAMEDLKELQAVQLEKLSVKQCFSQTQLQFTVDAWLQIIECRRVLKWTYAYGYYIPREERTKKQFFEYLQGEAEVGLERLHHCAEEELQHFVDETDDPSTDFDDFRKKLIGLTKVTKTYFENLVKALENDLADVAVDDSK
ncbi:BnaA05g11180D [Brassica napus]|uniref:RBR-type E3 ubiquitin transferase n=1 Tax=Brassica napus TaxID=3708 RepID=A0A078HZC3_BRANA|nr:BnaA05g11180D [Brassica napus]